MAASVILIEFCIHFMVSYYGNLNLTNFRSHFFEMETLLFLFFLKLALIAHLAACKTGFFLLN
jgi:hypothetical protein